MTLITLYYPAGWHNWFTCVQDIVLSYAGPDVKIDALEVDGVKYPTWSTSGPDLFLNILVDLLCTTLVHLHKYQKHNQQCQTKSKY